MNATIIKPCSGYEVEGQMFSILEDAQRAALMKMFSYLFYDSSSDADAEQVGCNHATLAAEAIIKHRAEVLAILSLEPAKERKPRSDRGMKRTKKIAPEVKAAA